MNGQPSHAGNVPQGFGFRWRRDGRGKHALHRHAITPLERDTQMIMPKNKAVRARWKIAVCAGAAKPLETRISATRRHGRARFRENIGSAWRR